MNTLSILEEKIYKLLDLIDSLKKQNEKVLQENAQLKQRLMALEGSKKEDSAQMKELEKEKELAKVFIDDLIKSIDSMMENESEHGG